jgi:hypothetical protein
MLETPVNTASEISREFHEGINALTITITQLLSRLESLNRDDHRRTRDIILEGIRKKEGVRASKEQEITAAIEMLDVSDAAEQELRTSVQDGIIRSLSYPAMTNRYEDLVEAHPKTFEWAFHDSTDEQLPWDNISAWLKRGDGVYWVSGKAGSEKSTFMKFLFDMERTREYLRLWAKDSTLCVATFFFWNSGTKQQKSQAGFLRALLFQVLGQCPDIVSIIFPRAWASSYSKTDRGIPNAQFLFSSHWQLQELIDAFRALIHQRSIPLKICFLVDGLDEFDGDHEEIARLFKEITNSAHIKVCLSSRPWVVFEELFRKCQKLQLQNLTYRDIELYVDDKLSRNDSFQRLAHREPKRRLR